MDVELMIFLTVAVFASGLLTRHSYGFKSKKRLEVESITDPKKLPYESDGYILSEGELRFYKVATRSGWREFSYLPKDADSGCYQM